MVTNAIKNEVNGLLFCLPVIAFPQPNIGKNVLLPNGCISLPAGRSLSLGVLPLNIAVSGSKKLMALTNNGQGAQSIQLINPATEKMLDCIPRSKNI